MFDAAKIIDPYLGNDRTARYEFNYAISDESHLVVTIADRSGNETNLVLDVDYTVDGVGDDEGGFITLIDDGQEWISTDGFLDTFFKLAIRHNPALVQDEDLRNQPTYDSTKHERAIDKVVAQLRAVDGQARRSLRAPETEPDALYLPPVSVRSNSLLGFSTEGEPVPTRSVIDSTGVSDYAAGLIDDVSPAKARTTLGFSGENGTIATENIEDAAVITAKIKNSAVTTDKFDDEDVMLPKIFTGLLDSLTAVDADADDYIPISDTSDSNFNKKVSMGELVHSKTHRALTANDSPTTADGFLTCSGSLDVTLYTAVGNAGREIEIFHDGVDFTDVVTLKTTSAQTIGGYASGAYKLCTNGESIRLRSNGTNWKIINHFCMTVWSQPREVGLGASTTAPTKGTATIYVDELRWRRVGDSAEIMFAFRKTASGSATAGAGDYLILVPTGMVIDTAKVGNDSTAESSGGSQSLRAKSCVGYYAGLNGTWLHGFMGVFNSSGCSMHGESTHSAPGTNAHTIGVGAGSTYLTFQADVTYRGKFKVPIVDWKP